MAKTETGYQTRFSLNADDAAGNVQTMTFNPSVPDVSLCKESIPEAASECGSWRMAIDRRQNGAVLYHRNAPAGSIILDRRLQGELSTWAWIPGDGGEPAAVALGTDVQCGIFVYGLNAGGDYPPLRYFRGHHDVVNSLAASPEGRYLVSGSRDGTVRHWPLAEAMGGYRSDRAMARRWGAELADQAGRLTVAKIDECSPLWHRYVRAGDTIDKIQWVEAGQVLTAQDPQQIASQLERLSWLLQVSFFTSRNGTPRAPFNLVAGWHELLSLYVADRDWISWTPSGYYGCSAAGERLIGWQFYKGDNQAPPFHTADKFSQELHRPDIIRKIFACGSVAAVLAPAIPVANLPSVVSVPSVPSVANVGDHEPPYVAIVSPVQNGKYLSSQITVEIEACARDKNEQLEWVKLLVDDTPIPQKTWEKPAPQSRWNNMVKLEWIVDLPPGEEHRIRAVAKTKTRNACDAVDFVCTSPRPSVKPNMYVLSIGISRYPGKWKLDYGHSDAEEFARVLKKHGAGIYNDVIVTSVLNEQATKAGVEEALARHQDVANSKNGDVMILFFSGHGMAKDNSQDEKQNSEFYLVPIDGSPDNLPATAVSSDTISKFCQNNKAAKVMVFLDACHSGGVGGSFNHFATTLGREEFCVAVIGSSKPDQKSQESPMLRSGFFTRALVQGLEGAAKEQDGYVYGPYEIFKYVSRQVEQMTSQTQTPQFNVYGNVTHAYQITKAETP